MKTFFAGAIVALILGIGTGLVYNAVAIGSAEHYATGNVQLPRNTD